MMIKVIYHDNRTDTVKEYLLEELIRTKKITGFRRSSGWVAVDRDPVRQDQRPFSGPERRKKGVISTFFG